MKKLFIVVLFSCMAVMSHQNVSPCVRQFESDAHQPRPKIKISNNVRGTTTYTSIVLGDKEIEDPIDIYVRRDNTIDLQEGSYRISNVMFCFDRPVKLETNEERVSTFSYQDYNNQKIIIAIFTLK